METRFENVGQVLNHISTGRIHRRLLALVGTTWALAAMEVLLVSFALPVLIREWSLSGPVAGALGSATLLGMAVGSWFGGWCAGRFGRVRTLAWAVGGYALCTGLTAAAPGPAAVFALRLLTGVGVGGAATAGTTYLSEHLPTAARGRYMVYFDGFWAGGTILAVVAAWVFLAPSAPPVAEFLGVPGWRALFAVAAFPAVLVPVLLGLEETPYYLLATGRTEAARSRLLTLAGGADTGLRTEAVALDGDRDAADRSTDRGTRGFRALLAPELAGPVAAVSLAWFGLNFGFYGVFIWLPDTVDAAGMVGGTYTYLFLAAAVQVPGYLTAAALIDRLGRKPTLGGFLVCSGLATYVFAAALPGVDFVGLSGVWPFLGGLLAASFFALGSFGAIRAYTPELFPTDVRSLATGVAEGTGRVAGIAGPLVAGALVGRGYLVALAPLATGFVVAGVSVVLLGAETRGRELG